MSPPRLHLIATGGTIASVASPHGHIAARTGADLLAQVAARHPGTDLTHVRTQDVVTRTSFALTLQDMFGVATQVQAALADDADAVVVTHGTDAMEETAFAADLVNEGGAVVFTGAQLPFDHPTPDGPRNLLEALRLAAHPGLADAGVLLAFAGRAWAARGVRKSYTLDLNGFGEPGGSPIATVIDDEIAPTGVRARRSPLPGLLKALSVDGARVPRVDVVATFPGSDGTGLRAARDAGAQGVVLQGLGAGNAAPADTAVVAELVAGGCPVLVTSRVVQGPVRPIYGGGGGADLAAAGAVFPSDVTTPQARVLLAGALTVAGVEGAADLVGEWVSTADSRGTTPAN